MSEPIIRSNLRLHTSNCCDSVCILTIDDAGVESFVCNHCGKGCIPVNTLGVAVKALLPEDKNIRCGYGPFSLRRGHPFEPACKTHDDVFAAKDKGQPTISRNLADTNLLRDMLAIAKERNSAWLKVQAYIYYGLARAFGKIVW